MVIGFTVLVRVVPLGVRPMLGCIGDLTGTGAVVICGDGDVDPPMLPAAASSGSMGTGIPAGTTTSVGAVTSMLTVLVGSADPTATGGVVQQTPRFLISWVSAARSSEECGTDVRQK